MSMASTGAGLSRPVLLLGLAGGILVAGTVIGVLLLGGMAAYSLAKLDLPGSGLLTLYLLIGTSLPIQLYLVPLYFT